MTALSTMTLKGSQIAKGLVVAASLLTASNAFALSCMQPNFAEAFNRLNAVEDVYNIGYGTLAQDGPFFEIEDPSYPFTNPKDPDFRAIPPRVFTAIFNGGFLDGNSVIYNNRYPVFVKTSCAGPWCGNFPTSNEPQLIMIKRAETGMEIEVGPCGGDLHKQPSAGQIEAIQSCLRFGNCNDQQKLAFGPNPG